MSTIREVAAKAGVSVTTVSRTLNNRGYISQSMRERIRKAMEELNYQPNEVARSLSRQHTRMIGVLVPEVNNPFFAEVVTQLSGHLTARGYKMLLYIASGTDDSAQDYVAMLRSNQVDGMIVALRSPAIEKELRNGMPVVSFERMQSDGFPTVVCDNLEGGRLAAGELLDCGCRCPVMLGGRHAISNIPAFERFRGYRETMEAMGRTAEIYEINEEDYHGNYHEVAKEFFRKCPDADGVFCTSDSIAFYVMQEALRLGLRIPQQLRIVGFNDCIAEKCPIPLTSVRQPLPEMCAAAVDSVICQIEQEPFSAMMCFPVSLSRRTSTRGYEEDSCSAGK